MTIRNLRLDALSVASIALFAAYLAASLLA